MSKENLKPNQVMASTLFVGVGGTGSKIVRSVAEMCRPEETENVNFVCLDTNANDLQGVAASKAHIYYVQTSNTQTVGDYLDYDEDARKYWFPKNAVMYDKTVSEGAGQVRAISRLALNSTIKTGAISPLTEAIDELFRKNGQQLKQALRVVMVSTASGGTGSGIILPLSMYIRDYVKNKYPNTSLIVRSLIMLPETLDSVISSSTERDSQRRNAYATIKEINAFMMKGSGFFDIDDNLKRYSGLHLDFPISGTNEKKSLSLLPFDFCFLMDGQDMEDSTLINLNQYMKLAAQALYEQNIGPMQKNAFSVEDNIIKEMSNPGNLGRNRFGGIGASVLRYPYEDIADYVAYKWALNAIGGEGDAAKWGRYDHVYKVKEAEMRKKGLSISEMQSRGEIYTAALKSGKDKFSKDLQSQYLQDDTKRIRNYFNALSNHMHAAVLNQAAIKSAMNAANELGDEIDYKNDEGKRGKARENVDLLRSFEAAVKTMAQRTAQNEADSLFENDQKTIVEKNPYAIESLIKNALGEISHPNATRYMLYLVMEEFKKRVRTTQSQINDVLIPGLEIYAPDANDTALFDAKYTRKKKESNLDELAAAEKGEGQDANLLEKAGGYETIYQKLNQLLPDYYNQIKSYAEAVAELEAYKRGFEFAKDACEMFESFYETFDEKVKTLLKKQNDIEDALKFHKGDSIRNICASRALLDELANSTGDSSAMLSSDLNGRIFDAIKANIIFKHEIENMDVVEDDRRVDIFDDIILGYFKDTVRRDCDKIDLNIIDAIAMEHRLEERIRMRNEQEDRNQKLFDKVSVTDSERYIRKMIQMGSRLAAPGIQKVTNEEARMVSQVAYNKVLDTIRNYRVDSMFAKGVGTTASDSVSKYEMHFFTALYNLTPDKLNKFASPAQKETRKKSAGLYNNAYMSYSKNLGPDSTKNRLISTHIDKRWDNIAVMPELDFDYMSRRIMRIHQSLIYALVYGAIQYNKLSSTASGKRVYRYENSEERIQEMIVSNGTLCDEFYEIIDALYMDASIVEDIFKIIAEKHKKDEVRNSNYSDTIFAKSLVDFKLTSLHEGKTSLFEIPVAYYNSLPNSQRFASEISGLIDAVVETYRYELCRCETAEDAKFMLCDILRDEFALLLDNYEANETLNKGVKAKDNAVIDSIFRRVRKVMTTTPEPDDYEETIIELKKKMQK